MIKLKKFIILILVSFISLKANAYSHRRAKNLSCDCAYTLQEQLEQERVSFAQNYENKLLSYVKLDNDSEFYEGTSTDEVVLLIHGFMASPFEVRSIGKRLNEIGYNVYMPLLYGFGSTGGIANNGNVEAWRNQVRHSVEMLSHCYKKISIGGISLGGALATDFVLNEYLPHQKESNYKITSLILLSPYYDISQSVAKTLVGPISDYKETVDLSTLWMVSHSSDLPQIINHAGYYNSEMPLKTLNELFSLSNQLQAIGSNIKSDIPVQLSISESDTTINLALAESFTKQHFSKVNSFKIEKDFKVPHQIAYENANPLFEQMLRQIIHTINHGNIITLSN